MTFLKQLTCNNTSLIWLFIFTGSSISAQDVLGLSMLWDHDPSQWKIYAETEEEDGRLETFDHLDARKMFWDYEIYGSQGRIWNLFPAQYNNWRLQADTVSISMQTVFQDRWPEWRISNGQHILTLRAAGLSNPFYWIIDHPEHGILEIYTHYENDPRDWEIRDELSSEIPLEMKVAATFIVVAVNYILL